MDNRDLNKYLQPAISQFENGKYEIAIEQLNYILEHWPEIPEIWFLLAVSYHQNNQFRDAEKSYKKAISLQTLFPDAYNNLGVLYEKNNSLAAAEESYRKAISQKPDYSNAHYNLGQLLQSQENIDEAIEHYLFALNSNPEYVSALNNLAMLYQTKGHTNKAKQYYLKALKLIPDDPEILNNYGYTLYRNYEYSSALDVLHTLLKKAPNFSDAYLNIGLILQATGDLDSAKVYFSKASQDERLALQAKNNIAHLELSRENYAEGWNYYQFRQSTRNKIQNINTVKGSLSQANRILLTKDQGIGDELFFLRFLPGLISEGKKVSYYCDRKLFNLLSTNLDNCEILDSSPSDGTFDLVTTIADLPRYASNISHIPPAIKLHAEQTRIEKINLHLPNNDLPNIAITWQAGVQGDNKLFKRIAPQELGSLLSTIEANIIILQRNPSVKDIRELERGLKRKAFNYSYVNDSLDNILALLAIVDTYIGVSNTNMHLMASLNKAAHVFVPHPPEWRWLHQGESSPWFPDFHLYRQNLAGEWGDALEKCRSTLTNHPNQLF